MLEHLKLQISRLDDSPGVYRFIDSQGRCLYVGKAAKLKKRVSSYLNLKRQARKTRAMLKKSARVEVTTTSSEAEALLLEQNLIKAEKPPYNIDLRDDKSYPFIFISQHPDFPYIASRRGRQQKGRYFGPYPSAGAVRESINALRKIFLLRNCRDAYFRNRSRPCLQHQIGRCSAPCVNLVSADEYRESLRQAVLFLENKSNKLKTELNGQMQQAAAKQDFETAAILRDRLAALAKISTEQSVDTESGDFDIVACQLYAGVACVYLLFVRSGQVLSNKLFKPKLALEAEPDDLAASFLAHYYIGSEPQSLPSEIIIDPAPADLETLQQALQQKYDRKIAIKSRVISKRNKWLEMAATNCARNLKDLTESQRLISERLQSLNEAWPFADELESIECLDISHNQGDSAVGALVRMESSGLEKKKYRKANIRDIKGGDDYAAMAQSVERLYKKRHHDDWPDLILIDGGRGQLNSSVATLQALTPPPVLVAGIAKGEGRRAGLETIWLSRELYDGASGLSKYDWPGEHQALLLLMQVRDEAHRFANSSHQSLRRKSVVISKLEQIDGIGSKRRSLLLQKFGSSKAIAEADVADIARSAKITTELAQKVKERLAADL